MLEEIPLRPPADVDLVPTVVVQRDGYATEEALGNRDLKAFVERNAVDSLRAHAGGQELRILEGTVDVRWAAVPPSDPMSEHFQRMYRVSARAYPTTEAARRRVVAMSEDDFTLVSGDE